MIYCVGLPPPALPGSYQSKLEPSQSETFNLPLVKFVNWKVGMAAQPESHFGAAKSKPIGSVLRESLATWTSRISGFQRCNPAFFFFIKNVSYRLLGSTPKRLAGPSWPLSTYAIDSSPRRAARRFHWEVSVSLTPDTLAEPAAPRREIFYSIA